MTIFIDALDELGEERVVSVIADFEHVIETIGEDRGHLKISFSCRHYPILILDTMVLVSVEKENTDDIKKKSTRTDYFSSFLGPQVKN